MTRRERLAWSLAVLYAVCVTAVAGALLVGGSLLAGVPRLPGSVDRRYGAATIRLLDVLFRPVDLFPTVAARDAASRNRYPDDDARSG